MPEYVVKFASYNPFVISENLLRQTIIFGASLQSLLYGIGILASSSVLMLAVIIIIQKAMKKHLLSRYARKIDPIRIMRKHKEEKKA
jgi:ABC-type polysaccharide/polyol phosphate export permease